MSPLAIVVAAIFLTLYIARLIYAFRFNGSIVFRRRKEKISNQQRVQPVSILITARNEEAALEHILPQLLKLNSVPYEVVAVDDYSQDNTYTILGSLKQKNNHLRISALNQETRFSTKLAQNLAMKSAKNKWVLVFPVDADLVNSQWLETIVQTTSLSDRDVMVGYSAPKKAPGFYNRMCRLENFFLQRKSAGYISNGIPFVYFEENVAFVKDNYFDMGGYGHKIREHYANLELMINSFMKKKNTELLFNSHARIERNMETKRQNYYELLQRSFKIEKHLAAWKRIFMRFDEATALLFIPTAALFLLVNWGLWPVLSALIFIKIIVDLALTKICLNRLNESKLFISSLVYGLIAPYFRLIYRLYFNRVTRRASWRNKT